MAGYEARHDSHALQVKITFEGNSATTKNLVTMTDLRNAVAVTNGKRTGDQVVLTGNCV